MLDADFNKLISNAHKLEDEFIELLSNEGDNVYIPTRTSPFSDYDFSINDIKYEIKLDNNMHKNNMMLCEFKSRGKDSAISITKADYYGIKSGNTYYIIPVKYIKDLILNNKFKVIQTGYNKYSSCYLISANNFKEFIIKQTIEELDF
jgi:hypothetical protein